MAVATEVKRRAAQVVRALARSYPDARCALDFRTPLELLVATILSAMYGHAGQPGDQGPFPQVSLGGRLRPRRPGHAGNGNPEHRLLPQQGQERRGLLPGDPGKFGGKVPPNLDALVQLPGIGRKTANVVLGTAYGVASGVVVDAHVGRISRRLGLTATDDKDAVRIEQDLMELIPQKEWIDFSHRMIHHGRRVCTARKPKCDACPLGSFCPRIGVARGKFLMILSGNEILARLGGDIVIDPFEPVAAESQQLQSHTAQGVAGL